MTTHFISLGGVGGCSIGTVLQHMKLPRYPFDWLVSRQDFVIKCILTKFENFINYDKKVQCMYLHDDRNMISMHDAIEDVNTNKEKYARRIERLYSALKSSDKIVFIRSAAVKHMDPFLLQYYDEKDDDLKLWENFFEILEIVYPQIKYRFVYLTDGDETSTNPNVIVKKGRYGPPKEEFAEFLDSIKF